MKDLSIIILNYNTKDFLRSCLESIQRVGINAISHEIYVVDNASSDGSVEMAKKEFPSVQVIESKKNVGFSAGNNLAVKKTHGRYLLFLNPDTIVSPNTLETMVKFMDSNKTAGAATCFVELPNGMLDDAAHRGFPTPLNSFFHFSGIAKLFPKSTIFNGYHLGWCDLDKTHRIDALAGAFMIVRKKAGDDIGWWDEDYFFYGEDLDFCYKLREKNWEIYFFPQVKILHYKGVSGGIKPVSKAITTATPETKKRSQIARFEAMRIFYKKHYVKKYPKIITWLVFLGISLRSKI